MINVDKLIHYSCLIIYTDVVYAYSNFIVQGGGQINVITLRVFMVSIMTWLPITDDQNIILTTFDIYGFITITGTIQGLGWLNELGRWI
jgi:hypothetical protein